MSNKYNWGPGYSTRDMQAGRRVITDSGPARDPIKPALTRATSPARRTPNVPNNPARDEEGDEGDDFVERAMHGDLSRQRNTTREVREVIDGYVLPEPRRESRGLPPGDWIDRRYLGQFHEASQENPDERNKRAASIIFGEPSKNEERTLLADFCRAVITDCRQPHAYAKHEWNKRLLSAGTGNAGGFAIPAGYLKLLITDPLPLTSLYDLATKIPTLNNDGTHPTISAVPVVTYGAETAAFDESQPTFGEGTYTMYRRSAMTKMTNNVIEDSDPSVIEIVQKLITEAMRTERERATAIGTGTNEPTGIYHSSGITDVAGVTSISYANLNKLLFRVDIRWSTDPSCVWQMNQVVLGACSGLVDLSGRPIFVQDATTAMRPYILGRPVIVNNSLPNNYVGIGAMKNFCVWDRGILLLSTTDQAGDSWEKGQTWIRISERQGSRYQAPPTSVAFVRSRLLTGIS
ncbi:MAG: phage major capsid protein [Planctomycetia bacterium]|nr:phage major capsid protein [Planctomycetia bacterium]